MDEIEDRLLYAASPRCHRLVAGKVYDFGGKNGTTRRQQADDHDPHHFEEDEGMGGGDEGAGHHSQCQQMESLHHVPVFRLVVVSPLFIVDLLNCDPN